MLHEALDCIFFTNDVERLYWHLYILFCDISHSRFYLLKKIKLFIFLLFICQIHKFQSPFHFLNYVFWRAENYDFSSFFFYVFLICLCRILPLGGTSRLSWESFAIAGYRNHWFSSSFSPRSLGPTWEQESCFMECFISNGTPSK